MKIVVFSKNQEILDELSRFLLEDKDRLNVSLSLGDLFKAEKIAEQNHLNLLIIDATCDNKTELATLERIITHHPDMAVILLCPTQSPEFLIEVMRVGVREVISYPLSKTAVLEAIARVRQRAVVTKTPARRGKVLAFIACKGGSGSTFIASNLGYVLAADQGKEVALLDLNLNFGDASLFVSDYTPANTLADLANNIQRLDASFLASSMVQVLPNYGVLAAPENPEQAAEVKPEHVGALINMAAAHYDFVLLDMSRTLDAVGIRALDYADVIFPVMQETLPFLRDAKRLLATFKSLGYSHDKIHLIVNRYEKGGDIRLEDVERTLGMKVYATVPNSYQAVSASVNQGVPVLKNASNDPVTKALLAFGRDLVQGSDVKPSGWFSGLFGHG